MKMESSQSSSFSTIANKDLPSEIIEEILVQLPVKSLLRFKSVSKSWLNLISDHNFIKSHLHMHDDDDDATNTHLMLSSSTSLIHSIHLQSAAADHHHVVEYPMMQPDVKDVKIIGSCNGIVCLVLDSKQIIVYNPSTRDVHQIPSPDVEAPVGARDHFYGFGYDSANDDVKIVRASSSSKDGNFVTHLDIFSLKTNIWRIKAKTLPFYFMSSLVGTLLNGALHWAVRRGINVTSPTDSDGYDPRPFGLVSFDLTAESYEEVPLPCDGDKQFSFYGLGVLGGCLSMLHSPHGADYQVWVMKEYGVKASWSVFATIPQRLEDSNNEFVGLMSLLRVLKNGEILMMLQNHNRVVIYNPGERKFRNIFNGEVGSSRVALYLETLVSPKTSSSLCILAS